MGVAGTVFGIVGNYVYSTILKKTQAYKYTVIASQFILIQLISEHLQVMYF